MKIRFSRFAGLVVAAVLLVFPFQMAAQEKKAPKKDVSSVQGTVQMIDKKTSTITVNTSATVRRDVVYSDATKFLYGHSDKNKPGSADEVKDSFYISCAGTYDAGKLIARTCVYRETR